MENFSFTVLDLLDQASRNIKTTPLNLGGVGGAGGGVGGPPGGFIGQLPQYRVAYDVSEIASSGTLPSGLTGISGWSLVDNLNHIRYRLNVLESGGSIAVFDDIAHTAYYDVTEVHFSGGASVFSLGTGKVKVISSGGSGGGLDTAAGDARYLKLDTSNDPLTGTLEIDATGSPGDSAIYGYTEGDSYTADFEQYNTTQNFASSPVIFGYRSIGNTKTTNSYLLHLMEETSGGATFSGGMIKADSDGTEVFHFHPRSTPNSYSFYTDTVTLMSSTGRVAAFLNQGSEMFAITGGGDVIMKDGGNIVVTASTGTKIGTSTSQKLGFFNATPIARPGTYSVSNVTTDGTYDANSTTVDELADVLGTLIADLKSLGLIG